MVNMKCWKEDSNRMGFHVHLIRVNMSTMKAICCKARVGQMEKSGKWPCGVCRKGVEVNSLVCTGCKQWERNLRKRCSGIADSLKVVDDF